MRLTLTLRHTLFLAGVIVIMSIGANLITANVVRQGLVNLLGQRLDYAGRSLNHYSALRIITRQNELNSLLTSPRFIAAIETGDESTIANESPDFAALVGASFMIISDEDGNPLYSTLKTEDKANEVRRRLSLSAADTLFLSQIDSTIYETLITKIHTGDGFTIGRIAIGYPIVDELLADLKKLTGFDVILTYRDKHYGSNISSNITSLTGSDRWQQAIFSVGEREISDQGLMHVSLNLTPYRATVTFVTSINDHISPILTSQLEQMTLMAVVGGLLAILVIFWFTRKHIGRQMSYLVSVTDRISKSDMEFTVEQRTRDEFGYLAGQLEQMRANLVQNRKDLNLAHAEQVRSERLAGIGQLATGIIHDFKSPMGVIRGTAELVAEKGSDPERVKRYVGTIKQQVDRMVELCQDILDYARGKSNLNKATITLNEYVDQIYEPRRVDFESRKIDFVSEGPDGVRAILDPGRFRRVLDNLITNALEVLSSGDKISISWSVIGRDLKISVIDDGPGIPEEIVATLFEPFVTCGKRTGTGLGLAISKKIIEDHGGTITVQSRTGIGTEFKICLPGSVAEANPAMANHSIESMNL